MFKGPVGSPLTVGWLLLANVEGAVGRKTTCEEVGP